MCGRNKKKADIGAVIADPVYRTIIFNIYIYYTYKSKF